MFPLPVRGAVTLRALSTERSLSQSVKPSSSSGRAGWSPGPLVYFELIFFIWCEVMVQLHSFAVVPAPFPFFSPSEFFFFLDWLSWFTIFSKFQVYNIVVYNFKRLYSIYSYDKNIGYVPCQHHFLKRLFFPHRLGSLVENQLTIDVWVYLWTFYSIPWINICPYASTTLFWSL